MSDREAFEKWIKENQTYNAQELDRGPVIPVDKVRELLQATPPAAAVDEMKLVAEVGWMANRPNTMLEINCVEGILMCDLKVGTKLYASRQEVGNE